MKNLLTFTLALTITSLAHAEENKASDPTNNKFASPDKIYFNPTLGFSPDMGAIGIEFQKGQHVVGIGLPLISGFQILLATPSFIAFTAEPIAWMSTTKKLMAFIIEIWRHHFLAQVLDTAGNGNLAGM